MQIIQRPATRLRRPSLGQAGGYAVSSREQCEAAGGCFDATANPPCLLPIDCARIGGTWNKDNRWCDLPGQEPFRCPTLSEGLDFEVPSWVWWAGGGLLGLVVVALLLGGRRR